MLVEMEAGQREIKAEMRANNEKVQVLLKVLSFPGWISTNAGQRLHEKMDASLKEVKVCQEHMMEGMKAFPKETMALRKAMVDACVGTTEVKDLQANPELAQFFGQCKINCYM
jgi:hypothetical protein